jgi:uncharacterized protein YdaU (DUF1376 family)
MAKDPILPLYYNDLDRSTRDWTDEEFGAYVRLLMHQWDKGSLPNDYQRLTRIATSLGTTWETIRKKFVEKNGELINERMEDIRLKREGFKQKQREKVLKRYQTSTELPTEHPTKKLPTESEIEIENEKEIEKKGGVEENEKFIVPQMLAVWKNNKKDYPEDRNKDSPALQAIAKFICDSTNMPYNARDGGVQLKILENWEELSRFISKDRFFKAYSLMQVEKHIQAIIQKMKNGTKQQTGSDSGHVIPIRKGAGGRF